MNRSLTVFSPATVANIACGYDILGFAVDNPGDEVTVTLADHNEVRITSITGEGGKLPLDPEKNSAGVSVLKMRAHLQSKQGFDIEIAKKMPLGSGLGSSAASAVGSVYAANKLIDQPLSRQELIPFAMEGERIACGTAHADNVAPALLGGFVAVRSYDPLDIITIPTDISLHCLIVKPKVEVLTRDARNALKDEVPMQDFVAQTGNLVGLIVGLTQKDISLISRSLVDNIIEPQRSPMIPGFSIIKSRALEAGALGCSISGSGPSIFSLYHTKQDALQAKESVSYACKGAVIDAEYYVTCVNYRGVHE